MSLLERYGLSPDPVIEHYKKDVDRTLLRWLFQSCGEAVQPLTGCTTS